MSTFWVKKAEKGHSDQWQVGRAELTPGWVAEGAPAEAMHSKSNLWPQNVWQSVFKGLKDL